jgi:hypothetical protein
MVNFTVNNCLPFWLQKNPGSEEEFKKGSIVPKLRACSSCGPAQMCDWPAWSQILPGATLCNNIQSILGSPIDRDLSRTVNRERSKDG